MFFDCSGASPTRSRVQLVASRYSGEYPTVSKTQNSTLSPRLLQNNHYTFFAGYFNGNSCVTPFYLFCASGIQVSVKIPPIVRGNSFYRGENDQSVLSVTALTSSAESSFGIAFQRIECAQV